MPPHLDHHPPDGFPTNPSGLQLEAWLAAAPDKVLALVAQMDDPAAMPAGAGPVTSVAGCSAST